MTTKTISGAYPIGYTLSAAYDRLVATSSAVLGETGGTGVLSTHLATFDNYGAVTGSAIGVRLTAGGTVVNQAGGVISGGTVSGQYGVEILAGAGLVDNYDTISGLIYLGAGGDVVNGSAGDTQAAIGSVLIRGAPGAVTNFGTFNGVEFNDRNAPSNANTFTNGSAQDTSALCESTTYAVDARFSGATIVNFGTMTTYRSPHKTPAIYVAGSIDLTNGSPTDTGALVSGASGIGGNYSHAALGGTIVNFGQIRGFSAGTLTAGINVFRATVINGSATDTVSRITGYSGVKYAATVENYGTISAYGSQGEFSGVGAVADVVINGSMADRTALIKGYIGVGGQTITNYGSIVGGRVGAEGQNLANGAAGDSAALIQGGLYGVYCLNGTVTNFGTIKGNGFGVRGREEFVEITNYGTIISPGTLGAGVDLVSNYSVTGVGHITNGAIGDASALIKGRYGVELAGGGTVTNFATIQGTGGVAVNFTSSKAVLEVEAGSTFIGAIQGGGGTLDLASGTGTLAGLFSPAGAIVAYGAIARTTFTGFGTLEIGAGASFSVAGYGTVAGGESLIVAGTLSSANTIASTGAITVSGILADSGTLRLSGGSAAIDAGGALTIASIAVSGGATAVAVDTSLTYAGTLKQTNGTLSVGAGDILTLTGADTLAGTLAGAGSVTVKTALTIGASEVLSGGVGLNLSNATSPLVVGATPSSRLVNTSGTIHGAGQLGGGLLTLVNKAGGVINGDGANILILNTGATAIYNAGLIKASGAGGVRIRSAITNYGTLQAQASNLTVQGAVTGSGGVRIAAGGVVDFTSSFSENVTFSAPTGTLELAQSQAYAGTLTGFSKSGGTSLDLADIAFTSGATKASYSGTTAGGVLTVTDGTHTAQIKLSGDYTASTFTVSSDGRGGTWVVDPPAAAAPLAQAIAAFQHGPPAHIAATAAYALPRFPTFHAQA